MNREYIALRFEVAGNELHDADAALFDLRAEIFEVLNAVPGPHAQPVGIGHIGDIAESGGQGIQYPGLGILFCISIAASP